MSDDMTHGMPTYRLPEHEQLLIVRLMLAWLEANPDSRDYFRELARNQYGLTPEEFAPYDECAHERALENVPPHSREEDSYAIALYGMSLFDQPSVTA